MKKLFIIAAALFCCFAAFAQDDEPSKGGTVIDFGVIGRIDSNPQFTLGKNSETSHNFANSCAYTSLDMSFGEHLHFSLINHWADTGGENKPFTNTKNLFDGTFWRSCSGWVDFLYMDVMAGGWTFRLGKDALAIAGWEYEPWDWEVVYDMSSTYWLCNPGYQWGGSIFWTSPSESTTLHLQAVSSYNHNPDEDLWKPWQNGYGQYTLKHSGEYGAFITSNAVSWKQSAPGEGYLYAGIGGGGVINDRLTLRAEVTGTFGTGTITRKGHNLRSIAEVLWSPGEKWDIHFKSSIERYGLASSIYGWIGEDPAEVPVINVIAMGCTVNFFPLRDNRDLRLMGTVTYNDTIFTTDYASTARMGLTFGILYNHVFHLCR